MRFTRRRNTCLYFSHRIFAFLSVVKNGEELAGASVHSPSPSALRVGAVQAQPAAGTGRAQQEQAGHSPQREQAAQRHPPPGRPCRDTQGSCAALHLLPSFHGFPLAHSSAFPFWASCLHPAPKTQGSFHGKAQPPLFVSRGQPAQRPRPAALPVGLPVGLPAAPDAPAARSRAPREELPGTPATPGTTRLTPQLRNYNTQKALRGEPTTA